MTRVLVLGVSGMLGHAVFDVRSRAPDLEVFGASRSRMPQTWPQERLLSGISALDQDDLLRAVRFARPDVIINAVGVIKQLESAKDPLVVVPINTLLPHRLAALAEAIGGRLVHVSTDCVFTGNQGAYRESDPSDATDLYGASKHLGEVIDRKAAITLRTSIIGRELNSANGLIEWFLRAEPRVKGFRKAIFSGLPTVELAEVIRDHVLPRPDMSGLYHVSAEPISKLDLLALASEIFDRPAEFDPVDEPRIDRSLNSDRFKAETGYRPAPWRDLLIKMRDLQPRASLGASNA